MSKHAPNNSNFFQGLYKLINPQKYRGNPLEVVYRSSWEKRFMIYCDLNPGILQWESEPYKIPYVDYYGKRRSYIPDFLVITTNSKNPSMYNKYIIEIKPDKETREPTIPQGYISPKQLKNIEYGYGVWYKNKHKWAYAKEWCVKNDLEFKLITEKQLPSLRP